MINNKNKQKKNKQKKKQTRHLLRKNNFKTCSIAFPCLFMLLDNEEMILWNCELEKKRMWGL